MEGSKKMAVNFGPSRYMIHVGEWFTRFFLVNINSLLVSLTRRVFVTTSLSLRTPIVFSFQILRGKISTLHFGISY